MSKPPGNGSFRQEDYQGAPSWFARFLGNLSPFTQYVSTTFNSGLTTDNEKCAIATLKFTHGQYVDIANPFSSKPRDVVALSTDGTVLKPVLDWQYTQSGKIRVTALFPLAEQFAQATTTTPVAIPNNANTIATFNAALDLIRGTNIAWDGSSKLTVSKKGLYDCRYSINWASSAVGAREAALLVNGSLAVRYGWSGGAAEPTAAFSSANTGGAIIPLNAGDFVQVNVVQSSGGALNSPFSAATPELFQVRQLSNDASLTARVTFKVVGA